MLLAYLFFLFYFLERGGNKMKTYEINFLGKIYKCSCDPNNIHIENSYTITRECNMRDFLKIVLKKANADGLTYKRSISEWIEEWKAHNKLYQCGIAVSHTKDVDLNEDESKVKKLGYKVVSKIC